MPPIIFTLDRFVPKGLPTVIAVPPPTNTQFQISGVTRDGSGNPLGNCTVKVYRTVDDVVVAQGVSDANGNYLFNASLSQQYTYYLAAILTGTPDVIGITDNNIVPV